VIPVPGDGDCLFHAVGLQLGLTANELRAAVAQHFRNFIQNYPLDNRFDGFLLADYNGNMLDYANAVAMPREHWGGDPEIAAIQGA
jgi:hypothetical protein